MKEKENEVRGEQGGVALFIRVIIATVISIAAYFGIWWGPTILFPMTMILGYELSKSTEKDIFHSPYHRDIMNRMLWDKQKRENPNPFSSESDDDPKVPLWHPPSWSEVLDVLTYYSWPKENPLVRILLHFVLAGYTISQVVIFQLNIGSWYGWIIGGLIGWILSREVFGAQYG